MAKAAHRISAESPLVEPSPVPDFFCAELSKIETIGPCSRLTFAVPQQNTYGECAVERIVVCKLVIPTNALASVAQLLLGGETAQELQPLSATLN